MYLTLNVTIGIESLKSAFSTTIFNVCQHIFAMSFFIVSVDSLLMYAASDDNFLFYLALLRAINKCVSPFLK